MRRLNQLVLVSVLSLLGAPGIASAHGSNPSHLRAQLISPFGVTGVVTSPAPAHHTVYTGDLSMDVAIAGGSAGYAVYFDAKPVSPATAVRAKVLQGGANAPIPACSYYSQGGYRTQLEIQVLNGGVWTAIGTIWYAHIDGLLKNNGDILTPPMRFAVVSSQSNGSTTCSTNPHLHMELYNYAHYAGYVPRAAQSTFGITDALGCWGGENPEDQPCP